MSLEDPSQPLLPPSALFESLGLTESDAGVLVNEQQAMRITTARACIQIIGEDLGSTSHEIIQNLPDGTIRPAQEHRTWPIVHDEPNPNMSSMVFWGAVLAAAVSSGNGYSWIKRDAAARIVSLVPVQSGKTAPVKLLGRLKYATTQTDTGQVAYIEPENMLHILGFTLDGILGISPIACRNAFGLALAAEKFGAQFFGNGMRATGVFSHPGALEGEALENITKSLRARASGENALSPLILEEGMKWTQTTIAPNDAQFLATRQFQRSEIAALYRVPLHLLQDLQRATNNNIEHQSLDYVRYCLRPWAVRIEQEVNRKLLKWPFQMEHNFNDMQRGDFASQTAGYQVLRNIGVYSTNDILRAMRQNPIPVDEGGDVRTVQGAMIPLSSLLQLESGDPEETTTDSDGGAAQPFNRLGPAFRVVMRDAVGRVINRADRDGEFVKRAFRPVVIALAQAAYAMRFGTVELTARDLGTIDSALGKIAESAGGWERKQASAIADRLTGVVYAKFAGEDVQ